MKRIRNIKIIKIHQITPNMKRITFSGNDLKDFPDNENGGYIKFLFKKKKDDLENTLVRPYTIRNFRKKELELDIDFSYHSGNQGYATKWAYNAKIGDEILISGPSSKQKINTSSKWYLFVGDMTALPAISTYLEELHENANGFAVIEIKSNDDKVNLKKPKNLKIKWVISQKDKQCSNGFNKVVRKIKWIDSHPYIWVACEFSVMKNMRTFFQKEKNITRDAMYISSYWKSGLDQEEHKVLKKEDSVKWGG